MDSLLIVALLSVVSISNVVCLIVGAKIGQKVSRGEDIKFPNPIEKVEEFKEDRERKKEQEALDNMMYNIDNYNGTPLGQKDIR